MKRGLTSVLSLAIVLFVPVIAFSQSNKPLNPQPLDILGINIGMDVDRATKVLRKKFPGIKISNSETLESGGGFTLTLCDHQRIRADMRYEYEVDQINKQYLSDSEEEQALKRAYSKTIGSIDVKCRKENRPFGDSVLGIVDYGGGTTDRIRLLVAQGTIRKGTVIAVTRQIRWRDLEINILSKLTEKLGSHHHEIYRDAYWFSDSAALSRVKQNKNFEKNCISRTPWPVSTDGFSDSGFKENCGVYLSLNASENSADMYLVDTEYVQIIRNAVSAASQKNRKKKGSKLKF